VIVFMGLAGAGKSTSGQLLAAHLQCPWVSTGNLLRQKMDAQTQKQMLRGEIVNDEQTLAVLEDEFRRLGADHRQIVLDGTPRTMRQARWLVEKERGGELKINAIIHLKIDQNKAKQRLLARQRPDDHEEAIAERFREYSDAIVPILTLLNKQGYKVYEINADQPPAAVEADIEQALGI
jgi:adenylate kinase